MCINPKKNWPEQTWLQLTLFPSQIKDLAGNPLYLEDSTFAWRIVSADTLSEISGRISDEDSAAVGEIILELVQAETRKKVARLVLPDTGQYRFETLFPGKYILQGFRDTDGNRLYSYGWPLPFRPAERFFVGQDTILVRSRWPNEGNHYQLKK